MLGCGARSNKREFTSFSFSLLAVFQAWPYIIMTTLWLLVATQSVSTNRVLRHPTRAILSFPGYGLPKAITIPKSHPTRARATLWSIEVINLEGEGYLHQIAPIDSGYIRP